MDTPPKVLTQRVSLIDLYMHCILNQVLPFPRFLNAFDLHLHFDLTEAGMKYFTRDGHISVGGENLKKQQTQ